MVDMANAGGYEDARSFTIGRSLRQTFQVFGLAPITYLILSAIPVIPEIVKEVAVHGDANGHSQATGAALIIQSLLAYGIQASIAYVAFRQLRGESFDVGSALGVGLKRFFPILFASVLALIIIVLGSLALVVPGFMAICALAVVIPACAIEKLGPLESLSRSAFLTKGSRWRILGLILVIGIPAALIVFLATFVVTRLGGVLAGELAGNVVQVVATALNAILVVVIYYDLRASKEGLSIDAIANVFD